MPVTLRFQSTGAVPGDGAPIVMRGPSLTIGRGAENDVVLPDPDRLISKNHCAIEDQNGNVVVIDFSTNGTFLNYGKVPLGRVPTPLNDGDVLTMGGYELVVSIMSATRDTSRDILPPVDDLPVSHGRADHAPDLMDLLDDPASRRVDFLDDLMGGATPRGPSQILREDPIDELDLPHLKDAEDPILGGIPEPLDDMAGSSFRHSTPSLNDGFSLGGARSAPAAGALRRSSLIPDDWDDDLLSPAAKATPSLPVADPFDAPLAPPAAQRPAPARPAAAPPPDAFDDLMPALGPAPAPPHATPAPLPTASVVPRPPAPRPGDMPDSSPFANPVPPARVTSVVPAPPTTAPAPDPVPPPAAEPVAPARPSPARPAAPAPAAAAQSSDPVRAFFEGAGAEDIAIPEAEMVASMHRLGQMVRVMIEGLREVLMTRAEIKGEFRMERTQINAGGNNPLKFALSPEHAVEMLLRPKTRGFMDASTAVKEALDDIKAHEVAMVTGMEAAIKDVLARLDPAVLSVRVGGGGLTGLLGNKKARYWEEYERLYGSIADEAENDFHEFFAKAFARAYQEQLGRLK